MTLTHRTKNTWHIDGDTLVLLDCHGVEIYCPAASAPYVLDYTWGTLRRHRFTPAGTYRPAPAIACVKTMIPDPRGGTQTYGSGQVVAKRTMLFLHRLIMKDVPHRPDQIEIDHIDGNPLNNRLDNLRWVTRSANRQNMRDVEGKPTRGVSYDAYGVAVSHLTRPWKAQIKVDGELVENEHFYTAREAEDQYLIWKRQYHTETPELWYEQYAACQASGYWE